MIDNDQKALGPLALVIGDSNANNSKALGPLGSGASLRALRSRACFVRRRRASLALSVHQAPHSSRGLVSLGTCSRMNHHSSTDSRRTARITPFRNRLRCQTAYWDVFASAWEDELAEEFGAEDCGLAVVAVVDFDEVEADGVGSDGPNDVAHLARFQAERLLGSGAGRVARVGGVDVDGEVRSLAASQVRRPVGDVRGWDDGDVRLGGAVPLGLAAGPGAENDGPVGDVEGVASDRGVAQRVAGVGLVEVQVGVEADEDVRVERADAGDGDGVFAADQEGTASSSA